MNNKGADQTARMRRLVCVFGVRKPPKTVLLASRPICTCISLFIIKKWTNVTLVSMDVTRMRTVSTLKEASTASVDLATTEMGYTVDVNIYISFNPLYTNGFFFLVGYIKLEIVHCTYLGVSGYCFP